MTWRDVLKNVSTIQSLKNEGVVEYKFFHDMRGTGESDAKQWAQNRANETGKNYLIFEEYDDKKDRYFFTAYQKKQGEAPATFDQIDIKPN